VYQKKTSLKRKTFKPKQAVKRPRSKAKKKSEARPAQVKKAIERLRAGLKAPPPGSPAKAGPSGVGPRGGDAGWPGGRPGGELIDVYKAEIASRIQKNWAFSEQLTGGRKDLSAVIVLKILPDGQIGDIRFEQRSGNSVLDDSAYRAVQKSNPLPPLPKGYFRSFYMVGLVFTPEGIQ
jgi:colicin import membrane protein